MSPGACAAVDRLQHPVEIRQKYLLKLPAVLCLSEHTSFTLNVYILTPRQSNFWNPDLMCGHSAVHSTRSAAGLTRSFRQKT